MMETIPTGDMHERLPAILDTITKNGGRVERYTGGVWRLAADNTLPNSDARQWLTSTPFIEELVLSGKLEWTDFHLVSKDGPKLPRGARIKRVLAESGAA